MSDSTTSVGNLGEGIAIKFLQGKGYRIIDTNYHHRPYGEIDIIAYKEQLVFVEVKSVRCRVPEDVPKEGEDVHRPEENVARHKKERLRRVITLYLENELDFDPSWRCDLICVYMDEMRQRSRILWLDNIII